MSLQLVTIAQVTVATSGTEQRLAAATADKVVRVYVSVPASNTGNAWIGDADVAVGRGVEVLKGTTQVFEADGNYLDIYNMWADVVTNGDKVNVSYLKKVSQ